MIVIDASVAVKWFLDEPSSDAARLLVDEDVVRIAPEHVLAEVGQVLVRAVRARGMSLDDARAALALVPRLVQLLPTSALADAAVQIALQVGCTHYDALYVASAELFGATLISADAKLLAQLNAAGRSGLARSLAP